MEMKKTVLLVVKVLMCCSLRHTFAQDDVQDTGSINNDITLWERESDLCNNYEIFVDGAVVPCNEFVPQNLVNFREPGNHLIKIREAETDSGVETPPEQSESNQTDSRVNATTPETSATPDITTVVTANNTTNSTTAKSTEPTRQEETTVGISEETTLESTTAASNVSTSNLNESSTQNATDASKTNETEVTTTPVYSSTESTNSTSISQTESPVVSANTPENTTNGTTPGRKNETSQEAHDETKKGRRLPAALPKDLAEVKSEIKELEDKEITDQKQSGNAIVYIKEGDSKTLLEGKDAEKAIANLEQKEELSEVPNTGESSSDIKKGAAKDTTILILLFVAVLVVFALGFVYSWVKNRRQEQHQRTLNENINSIRKSLQNLSTDKNEDIEAGTELKPLMKNSEKPVAEYTDRDETDSARKDDDQRVNSENNVKT